VIKTISRMFLCLGCTLATAVIAAGFERELGGCAAITSDADRLRCYDRVAGREAVSAPDRRGVERVGTMKDVGPATRLERDWELRPDLEQGTFNIAPYRPLYLLAHYMWSPNDRPFSPTRQLDPATDVTLNPSEAKFQLSFKTKLAQNLFGSPGDLWFGYTQRSFWQIGNKRYSSPFRETNYEPELMYLHPLALNAGNWTARYVAVSLDHQSNGRDKPLSRSWNRLIGDLAAENGPWALHLRPWVRIFPAHGTANDNPDITDYVGRGEMLVEYRSGRQVVSFTGRHTLRGGSASRGSGQVDWAFPLAGSLNAHVQLFSGYGESLIDYNHRQTSLGVGISFND
jgi:phospholipase A1/A2